MYQRITAFCIAFKVGLNLSNDKSLDWSKLKWRQQNKCDLKVTTYFGKGRKHDWKRKECRLLEFSPLPTTYFYPINPFPHNDTC